MSSILTSESSLYRHISHHEPKTIIRWKREKGGHTLSLELIRQYEIRMIDQLLISRHDILRHVEVPVVAHDRVQNPEEAAGPRLGFPLERLRYPAHGLDGRGARDVARQHHVEVVEVRLA